MKKTTFLSVFVLSLSLAACSGVKEELGLTRNSPDEFTVVKRAPLSLPPEYDLLPPGEGAYDTASTRTDARARTAVFGDNGAKSRSVDNADSAFLAKAGAMEADPEIRAKVARENGYVSVENRSTIEKLLRRSGTADDAVIVDAEKEAARIRGNAEAGQSITTGDVPVIEQKKSTIEKIF